MEGTGASQPLSPAAWAALFDEAGRIGNEYGVRKVAFQKGVEPSLRPEVWKYLTGVYAFSSTFSEREQVDQSNRERYLELKRKWVGLLQAGDSTLMQHLKMIEKDVARTDRDHPFYQGAGNAHVIALRDVLMTHALHDPELGYIQGMSDLLSPLLLVEDDEVDAFWCFAACMRRMRGNFISITMKEELGQVRSLCEYLDAPLHAHLQRVAAEGEESWLFCYRWLLLDFKREFALELIAPLWEAIWANHATPVFTLFFALAVLISHRSALLSMSTSDVILKYLQDLCMRMDMAPLLDVARQLVWRVKGDPMLPDSLRAAVTHVAGAAGPPPGGFVTHSHRKRSLPRPVPSNPDLSSVAFMLPLSPAHAAAAAAAAASTPVLAPPPLASSASHISAAHASGSSQPGFAGTANGTAVAAAAGGPPANGDVRGDGGRPALAPPAGPGPEPASPPTGGFLQRRTSARGPMLPPVLPPLQPQPDAAGGVVPPAGFFSPKAALPASPSLAAAPAPAQAWSPASPSAFVPASPRGSAARMATAAAASTVLSFDGF